MSLTFSIITCTLNSASFLDESIASVLSQDYPDTEYIFVDGGSSDATLEMIRAIPRKVTLIENVRGGIARAMNVGLAAATGEVIAHLHSDDYYTHSQALRHAANALEQSGAEWLFGRCLSDIDGQRVPENYTIPRYSHRRLLKGNFIPHPATFVRRRLLQQAGDFDESVTYAMDYDLWLRLGKVSVPFQLDEHLAAFRWHAGSLTSANRMASFQNDFDVRMRHASKAPWSVAYHWATYLVRRRRLANMLAVRSLVK
jgi:glycosyltransferase involved in cell wall biosynthesis